MHVNEVLMPHCQSHLKPNCWFEAGSKLVADSFEAGSNMSESSFETASNLSVTG